jgi:MEMO1 family protein
MGAPSAGRSVSAPLATRKVAEALAGGRLGALSTLVGQTFAAFRPAAIAGRFYPAEPEQVLADVDRLLEEARASMHAAPPDALVVPHAGWIYSGPTAAIGYASLGLRAPSIERVVIIGPAHRVPLVGIAHPGARAMQTPLGLVPIDVDALEGIAASPAAHAHEHCLEVQLPFVQRLMPQARVVPLLVGRAPPREVHDVLDRLWRDERTLVLVSSDLSHFLPYDVAHAIDEETCDAIVSLDTSEVTSERACGAAAIAGFLPLCAERRMRAELLDMRSSGDTAGSRSEVVGYASIAFRGAAA